MRIIVLLLLTATLGVAEHLTPSPYTLERYFYIAGPGGSYGFYELTSSGRQAFGYRSAVFVADREFHFPFRVSRASLAVGFCSALLVGGTVWYRRCHRARHDNAA